MARTFENILMGHYKKATKEPSINFLFAMDDQDCGTWYILMRNFDGESNEWTGGEFMFKLVAPRPTETDQGFPMKPPQFYALTPNGVYEQDKICCISIGQYHPDNYRPTLGMYGFARELMNGLIAHETLVDSGGINLIRTKHKQKVEYSQTSREYNEKHYAREMQLLREAYAHYSKEWKEDDMKRGGCDLALYKY